MRASLSAELLKLRRRPAMWLIAGVWLALSVVFGYLFPYLSFRGEFSGAGTAGTPAELVLAEALPGRLAASAIQGFPLFAGALALILGALAAGSEYGWGTMKTVLARGPGRLAVLAGKVGALGLVMLAVVLATFAVDAAASWLVAVATSHPVVDVLLRWTPATNAGSLAAALGVPVQGAPGGTPGITTMVDGTHATLVQRRDVT